MRFAGFGDCGRDCAFCECVRGKRGQFESSWWWVRFLVVVFIGATRGGEAEVLVACGGWE